MREVLPIDRLREGLRAWDLQAADVLEITPGATADVFVVLAPDRTLVAKYNYDYRDYFEVGLRVARSLRERAADKALEVSVPIPTNAGSLTEMVEWPDGRRHPLAVLTFVGGDVLAPDAADAPSVVGDVCGKVHSALLELRPEDVGAVVPTGPDGDHPDRDAGSYGWLHELWRDLEQACWDTRGRVRHGVGVWDGPDIRRRPDGRIGLLDFGHSGWYPLIHVVSNRSLNAALSDESRLEPFLAAVSEHLALTPDEVELFGVYRLRNAAIYARWVAMEKVARGESQFNDRWFCELLGVLERELPRIGRRMSTLS